MPKCATSPSPGFSLRYLVSELFGGANESKRYVMISDGGHFENLAAYELVRRRCRVVIVSDGDTIPDSGMPELPRAIQRSLVVGVGDALAGKYIDGHQSRQDAATLRQLAARLRGDYFDANQKHLPSTALAGLSKSLPLRDTRERGLREAALISIGFGSMVLAFLPVALAFIGSAWQAGIRSRSAPFAPALQANSPVTAVKTQPEKMTYA